MIAVLFIRAAIMNTILTKYPISDSVLTEDCDHESQSSYQHCHYQQTPSTNIE